MNYIQEMRQLIGSRMLMTIGCGIILEENGQILLQHRKDKGDKRLNWGFIS